MSSLDAADAADAAGGLDAANALDAADAASGLDAASVAAARGGNAAGALISHRDGIVGPWRSPAASWFPPLPVEDPVQLARWAPSVRAAIFQFELLSNLHFAANAAVTPAVTLWNLRKTTAGDGMTAPVGTWESFVTLERPNDPKLRQQLDYVNGWSDLRSDRLREILTQKAPQYAFWGSVIPLYPARSEKTLELISVCLRLASSIAQRFKHSLCVRRPHEYSAQIQPIIQTPGHGSLPSGHATEAFAVAWLLIGLMTAKGGLTSPPGLVQQLMAQAARIAINRTVAGVHYPVDSLAGQLLGLSIAEYFVARCQPSGAVSNIDYWTLYGDHAQIQDFSGAEIFDLTVPGRTPTAYAVNVASAVNVEGSDILNWLWNAALNEW